MSFRTYPFARLTLQGMADVCPTDIEMPQNDIFRACYSGNIGRVKEMLDEAQNKALLLHFKNRSGSTLLHVAALANHVNILQLLLEYGADINVSDHGLTALHLAANDGAVEAVEFLLAKGADASRVSDDGYFTLSKIPLYMSGGKTPLHFAAEGGEAECVEALLAHGCGPTALDNDGNTPVMLALVHNNVEVAQLMDPSAKAMTADEIRTKLQKDNQTRQIRIDAMVKREKEARIAARQKLTQPPQEPPSSIESQMGYQIKRKNLLDFGASFLSSSFFLAIQNGSEEALRGLVTEKCPNVFEFDMMTPNFCDAFLAEIDDISKSGLPLRPPNSMNNYGVVVDNFGFKSVMSYIVRAYINPLSRVLFPDDFGGQMSWHHAFVVRYKMGEDTNLDEHVDNSEITLNIPLGKKYTGGELYFRGRRPEEDADSKYWEFTPEKGRAVIHLGRHIHGVNHITSGERAALIIWARRSPPPADD